MNYIDGNAKVKTTAESFAELIDETKKDLDKEDQIMLDALEEKKNGSSDKDVFIYETDIIKHSLLVPLTKDEKLKLVDEIIEIEDEIKEKENELEHFKQSVKAEIKDCENSRDRLFSEYKKGKKEVIVEAYWRMNYPASGVKTFFRKDNGEIIKSADMTGEDKQLTISMWQKVTGQEPEKAEEETTEENIEETEAESDEEPDEEPDEDEEYLEEELEDEEDE